jgi:hypothetical protein
MKKSPDLGRAGCQRAGVFAASRLALGIGRVHAVLIASIQAHEPDLRDKSRLTTYGGKVVTLSRYGD